MIEVPNVVTWLKSWFYDEDEINAKEQALQNSINNKVDKVTGKGLSTNDYTTTEKNKLANIEARANKTVVDSSMSSTSTNPVQNKVIWENCVFQDDYESDTVSNNIPLRISSESGQYLRSMGFTNDDTIEEVLEEFAGRIANMQTQWNNVYPVGAIYMSVDSTSPSTLFGGTWVKLENRFLLASGTKTVGSTGGEENHTLTVNEMPSHTHAQNPHNHKVNNDNNLRFSAGSGGSYDALTNGSSRKQGDRYCTKATAINQNTGGGQAHNNMPPYLVVHMWRRTS